MGKQRATVFSDVTNITQGSVSLPEYGILRSGKTASVRTELLNTRDYIDFIQRGIIAIGDMTVISKKEDAIKKAKANLLGRDGKSRKDKGKSIKRVGSDGQNDVDGEFENGVEPGEDDGIIFVDIEQNQERIRSHPVLSKLQNRKNN